MPTGAEAASGWALRAMKRLRTGFSTNSASRAATAFRPTAMANTEYQP
jgi:hypothetical protein